MREATLKTMLTKTRKVVEFPWEFYFLVRDILRCKEVPGGSRLVNANIAVLALRFRLLGDDSVWPRGPSSTVLLHTGFVQTGLAAPWM